VKRDSSEWFSIPVGSSQGGPVSPSARLIFLENILDAAKDLAENGVEIWYHSFSILGPLLFFYVNNDNELFRCFTAKKN
jgi:hypothetical protein